MSADLQQPANTSLSPRAGIAMLTLQIRATLQEAAEVEAQYVDVDHDAAKRQLRERLEPLIQERTRSFAEAIDAAKDEAARTIAAAHHEASQLRAASARRAEEAAAAEAERIAAEEAEAAEAERIAAEEQARLAAEAAVDAAAIDAMPDWAAIEDDPADDELVEPEVVAEPEVLAEPEVVVEPEVVQPSEVLAAPIVVTTDDPSPSPFARQTLPPPPPQQINVSIDAEAFAKVFATVFASIVEQRLQHAPPAPVYMPYALPAPAQAAPTKQGFWRHARHPDVLLLGLATAIVLVVLAAWLA